MNITDESGWPTLKVSDLYNNEPIGVGTPLVESLTSYVSRLAADHFVNVSYLVKYVIASHLTHARIRPDNMIIGDYKSVTCMNGSNTSARSWVDALEQLTTRTDLHVLTLLPFAHLFSDKETMRRTRRWCPNCLSEWQEKQIELYEPLIWCIEAVEICPIHLESLESLCPDCGNSSSSLAPRTLPGYCSHCGAWLGRPTAVTRSAEPDEYQKWAAVVIGELLKSGSLEKQSKKAFFPEVLDYLIEKRATRNGIQSIAKLIGVRPKRLWEWMSEERQPCLHDLMRLCWLFNLKLVDLESEKVCEEKHGGYDERIAEALKAISPSKSKFDWIRIEKLLHDIIADKVPPMRVTDIVDAYGCHPVHLYRRYSDLCQAVTAKYAQHRRGQRSKVNLD